jgi:hypothetical protein
VDGRDRAYFLRRAIEEQEAGRNAACVEARERHEKLAAAYRLRCRWDGAQRGPVISAIMPKSITQRSPVEQQQM